MIMTNMIMCHAMQRSAGRYERKDAVFEIKKNSFIYVTM